MSEEDQEVIEGQDGESTEESVQEVEQEVVEPPRGLVYVDLNEDLSEQELDLIYSEVYGQSIFVNFMGINKIPKTKMVRGSNQCKISCFKRDKRLIILSTIDNLVKGAAGQAIQNLNIIQTIQTKLK